MRCEDDKNESFLEIDEHRLDYEWVRQPRLYHRYARELADAQQELAEAKASLEVLEAEFDRDIRADPDGFGITKVSESAIKNRVLLVPAYQSSLKTCNGCKHRVDVLKAVVDTLEHRKKALENLVLLWSRDYFSEPKAPGDVREKMAEVERKTVFGGRGKKGNQRA